MPFLTHTIAIDASPDRVWAVMSDVERWHEWTASITSVERLDDGPVGVGSRARVRQPKLRPSVYEITSWTPGREFTWATRQPGVTGIARHVVEPVDGGSRVTLSVEFSGLLATVVAWLAGGLTRRYMAMEAAGLKARAEHGVRDRDVSR